MPKIKTVINSEQAILECGHKYRGKGKGHILNPNKDYICQSCSVKGAGIRSFGQHSLGERINRKGR